MPRTKGSLNKKTEHRYVVTLTTPSDKDSVWCKTFNTISEISNHLSSNGFDAWFDVSETTIARYVTGEERIPPFFTFDTIPHPNYTNEY